MKKVFLAVTSLLFFGSLAIAVAQPNVAMAAKCGGVETAYIDCDSDGTETDVDQTAVWQLLEIVLNIMIGGVAIAAVGGLVYAAIIYASAQDNASQVQQAKGMIQNVVIGLVMFIAMWAGLQYLIPGGVF